MTFVSKRLVRVCFVLIGISLIVILFPVSLLNAGDAAWSVVPLPTEGESGRWVLANGADTKYLTAAKDGTLYCYATPTGTTERLFKSTDRGTGWTSTGHVKDMIVAIAVDPDDADTLYYATSSNVFRSTDGGNTFTPLPANLSWGGNKQITSLAVASSGDRNLITVGVSDWIKGQYGGVYILDENSLLPAWTDTAIGNYDVYHVAFSPEANGNRVMAAIASNESDVIIKSKLDGGLWSQAFGDAVLPGISIRAATTAFPSDYTPFTGFFFALDSGVNRGGVFRITPALAPRPSIITPLGLSEFNGADITSLSISGATLIAGCSRQALTYTSIDGGAHWIRSQAPPTGQSDTFVVTSPDFRDKQTAYLVTSGVESGFSVSIDAGLTWSQTSLIDSKISNLVDFSTLPPSPSPILFLVTHNGTNLKYSLWRSLDDGSHWQRTFNSTFAAVDSFNMVKETADGGLFVAGLSRGLPVSWFSYDIGKSFLLRPAPCPVEAWTFADRNNFFIGGYNGSKGVVYRTENGGISYFPASEVGSRSISAIVLSPDYLNDRTIAAGNTGGQVFFSFDNGTSFTQIGQQFPVAAGTGKIKLAFDRNFKNNHIIYASVDTKTTASSKERIFRFTIGQSTAWQSMYGSLPEDAIISQVVVTDDGILYAVNGQGVVSGAGKGGLLRTLSPTQSGFELTTRGLDETVILNGLWVCGNHLYSLDTKYTRLMTMNDTLAAPTVLESPADKSNSTGTDMRLEWQSAAGATEYEWQVNDEMSFSSLPIGFSGLNSASSARLTNLKPATAYYWRVRAVSPFHSPWSEIWSFSTLIGGKNIAPVLTLPEAGSVTDIEPIFLWQPVPGADRYELMVSNETGFALPVIYLDRAQPIMTNAWHCDIILEHNTTYFWKVRACTAANSGEWSAVSAFTTEPAPSVDRVSLNDPGQSNEPQPKIAETVPPVTMVQFNIPDQFLYIGLALLIFIVFLLAALIALLLLRKHL